MSYRYLEKGEIIQEDDEVDVCRDPMKDDPVWVKTRRVGQPAPDPTFPGNTIYRRKVN